MVAVIDRAALAPNGANGALPSVKELAEMLYPSPRMPQFVQALGDLLREEQRQRECFHAEIEKYIGQKVEFINGEIVTAMSVGSKHTTAGRSLLTLLSAFAAKHRLGFVGYEKTMLSLSRNDYEPDICFFGKEKTEALNLSQNRVRYPAADFVVEILSPSTLKNDRGIKFEDYAANGISEYWIVDPELETVEQYVLRGDAYELLTKAKSGTVTSVAVAGFTIPIRAMFDADENLAALQEILK